MGGAQDARDACIAAHYLARVQTTAEDSLFWNVESLPSADAFGAETLVSFYHSLYLNIGKSYEEMGNRQEAGKYYELAQARLHDLEQGKIVRDREARN